MNEAMNRIQETARVKGPMGTLVPNFKVLSMSSLGYRLQQTPILFHVSFASLRSVMEPLMARNSSDISSQDAKPVLCSSNSILQCKHSLARQKAKPLKKPLNHCCNDPANQPPTYTTRVKTAGLIDVRHQDAVCNETRSIFTGGMLLHKYELETAWIDRAGSWPINNSKQQCLCTASLPHLRCLHE